MTTKKQCACGCGKRFTPRHALHKYATPECKNRVMQRNLRNRAKQMSQLQSERTHA